MALFASNSALQEVDKHSTLGKSWSLESSSRRKALVLAKSLLIALLPIGSTRSREAWL